MSDIGNMIEAGGDGPEFGRSGELTKLRDRIKELEATIAEYQATEQRLRDRIDQLYDEMGTQDDERGYE